MTLIIGIDPGKSGALFLYDPIAGLHECADVPLHNIKVGGKTKSQPDFNAWAQRWFPLIQSADVAYVEKVSARPGQGVTSMFSFGYTTGYAHSMICLAQKPHTFLTPQSWKRIVGLSGSSGDESRKRASELMPDAAHFWQRKKDDGRAEAALIAYAGYQITTGVSNAQQIDGRGDCSSPQSLGKPRRKKRTRSQRAWNRPVDAADNQAGSESTGADG